MFDPVHLNARADECTAAVIERGHRVVQYRGEGYVLVGFYFARGHSGQRDLYYILRPADGVYPISGSSNGGTQESQERVRSSS